MFNTIGKLYRLNSNIIRTPLYKAPFAGGSNIIGYVENKQYFMLLNEQKNFSAIHGQEVIWHKILLKDKTGYLKSLNFFGLTIELAVVVYI